MPKKGYTPEQIINKLREAEILLNEGASCRPSDIITEVDPISRTG